MLKSLKMSGVGPAPEMSIEFAPRVNALTGDNGLGKSFLLDIAWWAFTYTWARGVMAVPRKDAFAPSIKYREYGASMNRFGNFPGRVIIGLPAHSMRQ